MFLCQVAIILRFWGFPHEISNYVLKFVRSLRNLGFHECVIAQNLNFWKTQIYFNILSFESNPHVYKSRIEFFPLQHNLQGLRSSTNRGHWFAANGSNWWCYSSAGWYNECSNSWSGMEFLTPWPWRLVYNVSRFSFLLYIYIYILFDGTRKTNIYVGSSVNNDFGCLMFSEMLYTLIVFLVPSNSIYMCVIDQKKFIYYAVNLKILLHRYFSYSQVIRHFDGCKADLVVCDGAPDG